MEPLTVLTLTNGTLKLVTSLHKIAKKFTGLKEKIQGLEEDLQLIEAIVSPDSTGNADGHRWRLEDAIHDALELIQKQQSDNRFKRALTMEKLSGIAPELRKHLQTLKDLPQPSAPRNSNRGHESRKLTDKYLGYGKEYEKLVGCLLGTAQSSDGQAQVVAVIGRGGIGKTELVCRVFNQPQAGDKNVRDEFELHIWASVYGKNTENELLEVILTSAPPEDRSHYTHGQRVTEPTNIQTMLSKMTKKKRFLLVLDDVTPENEKACKIVTRPLLNHGDKRSRILMTTRAKSCSKALEAGTSITLNGISDNEIKRVFKRAAFGNEEAKISQDLQDLLDDNVGKLRGSPLAAETVGDSLKDKSDSSTWKQRLNEDQVAERHLSSYYDLPQHLKRCLAFCSIFPREWDFEREKLTRMWVAHGFVDVKAVPNRSTREEEEARKYFDELVDRSLFEKVPDNGQEVVPGRYVIHVEIHSMLCQVAPNYFHSISDKGCTPLDTVRHLSVSTDRVSVKQLKDYQKERSAWLKTLRTLLVYKQVPQGGGASSSSSQSSSGDIIGKELLKKFEGVRVLDFSHEGITVFPGGVISELSKVRYLALPDTNLELGLNDIAKMKNLKSLHGTLSIKILQTDNDASACCLKDTEHLEVLKLAWEYRMCGEEQNSADFQVLAHLQPHVHLKELHIAFYAGTKPPPWLENLENLRSLHLSNCWNLNTLRSLRPNVKVILNECPQAAAVPRVVTS